MGTKRVQSTEGQSFDLGSADGVMAAMIAAGHKVHLYGGQVRPTIDPEDYFTARAAYCPRCCAPRNIDFVCLYSSQDVEKGTALGAECRECHLTGVAFLHTTEINGPTASYLWPVAGGLATPSTPEAVRYYLDQAGRCEGANARSAALAMYRAAVEHVLFEFGFTDGMLGNKIKALDDAIKSGAKVPDWANSLDRRYLAIIKDLGNGAIHANGGDISVQSKFDDSLISAVRVAVSAMLDVIYEQPARRSRELAILERAVASIAPPPAKKK